MLNLEMGEQEAINGQLYLRAAAGKQGHAVYGPYLELLPGRYVVGFDISSEKNVDRSHENCAAIDVVIDNGHTVLVSEFIRTADLAEGRRDFHLEFVLAKPAVIQFRVHAFGLVPLLVSKRRPVRKLEDGQDAAKIIAMTRFPALPETLRSVEPYLRNIHSDETDIVVQNGEAIASVAGTRFFANTLDDMILTADVLFDKVYRFDCTKAVLAIDIGMNIGLSCLAFARQSNVVKVHGYEPFRSTFDRAARNFTLNPAVASKIVPHCMGLSNYTAETEITVHDSEWSGSMRILPTGGEDGVRHRLNIKDAAEELGPIIKEARDQQLGVLLKVDCEGSEFAIFESLHAADLFQHVTAIMVEWHPIVEEKRLADLLDPLKQAGFIIFDRSPPRGNGFFYAARIG